MKQTVPFEIVNWEDPEIAAVRVMLQYMTDRMYDKIRGRGWTYGVSMSTSVTEGRMSVSFIRSSNINNAYSEFRAILVNYTNMGKGVCCKTTLYLERLQVTNLWNSIELLPFSTRTLQINGKD